MDPTWVFNFFTFFERILYKSNCIIFIFSWCATHTKIRSKLVVIVTAGSQKITLWGPQRTPLGILRVKWDLSPYRTLISAKWQFLLPTFQENLSVPSSCVKQSQTAWPLCKFPEEHRFHAFLLFEVVLHFKLLVFCNILELNMHFTMKRGSTVCDSFISPT